LLPSSPRLLPHLLDNDATVFVIVVRGLGGRSDHSRQCPRHRPRGEGTLQKSNSSVAAAPTATSTSTGPRVMGRTTREDDVEVGVPSTTTMMTMAAATTTVGAPPRCPVGSGATSRPPSKGIRRNSAPRGSRRPPRRDRDRLGVGGVGTPTTGPDDHRDPDGEKIEVVIEGGEDGRRDFKRASFVARIAPPMLPRARRRKGVDRRGSSSPPGRRRRLPARVDRRRAAVVIVCCPSWTSFAIWDRRSYVALLGRVSPSGIGVLSGGRRRTRKMTATVRERRTMTRER
jgi:hypothetical protein